MKNDKIMKAIKTIGNFILVAGVIVLIFQLLVMTVLQFTSLIPKESLGHIMTVLGDSKSIIGIWLVILIRNSLMIFLLLKLRKMLIRLNVSDMMTSRMTHFLKKLALALFGFALCDTVINYVFDKNLILINLNWAFYALVLALGIDYGRRYLVKKDMVNE